MTFQCWYFVTVALHTRATPSSQARITWFCPITNLKGLPRSLEESNFFPLVSVPVQNKKHGNKHSKHSTGSLYFSHTNASAWANNRAAWRQRRMAHSFRTRLSASLSLAQRRDAANNLLFSRCLFVFFVFFERTNRDYFCVCGSGVMPAGWPVVLTLHWTLAGYNKPFSLCAKLKMHTVSFHQTFNRRSPFHKRVFVGGKKGCLILDFGRVWEWLIKRMYRSEIWNVLPT